MKYQSDDTREIRKALMEARKAMTLPQKDKNGNWGPYCSIESIFKTTVVPLETNNIIVDTSVVKDEYGKEVVAVTLTHLETGQFLRSAKEIILEANTNQKFGASMTYIQRYLFTKLIGLAGVLEDNDPENEIEKITKKQAEDIIEFLADKPDLNKKLLAFGQIKSWYDLALADYAYARRCIEAGIKGQDFTKVTRE